MANEVVAVMLMDGAEIVASRLGVSTSRVVDVVKELKSKHGGHLSVLIGQVQEAPPVVVAPEPEPEPEVVIERGAPSPEIGGVELAHHMLWESYKRASQVQAFMLDKMTNAAVDMNRRYVEQMEELRAKYSKALEKIDGLQFEQKMLEHENAARHLSNHYARMAEDERIAAMRRRREAENPLEQLARGVMRVVDIIGNESIDKN